MPRVIGFGDFPKAWEGPVEFEFSLYSEHTKTVRYKALLDERTFDVYVPLCALPSGSAPPRIHVTLGKARSMMHAIGFGGGDKPKDPDILEYKYSDSKVNSELYTLCFDEQIYSLYIPNEVFAGEAHPDRVFVQVGPAQD